jgi:hypothetical protein
MENAYDQKPYATPVTGGCLCGSVRYEADVFLQNGYACHCTICQRSTGQPAEITVLIRAGSLMFTKGQPKYFQTSGFGRRGFCGDCGSRLVWQAIDQSDDWMTNLCVGGLDNPKEVKIACHMYVDTKLPWYDFSEHLPTFREDQSEQMLRFIKLDK